LQFVQRSQFHNHVITIVLLTKMLKRDTKMRCRVISACYLFIIYNLVSGSGAGARNTDSDSDNLNTTQVKTEMHNTPQLD